MEFWKVFKPESIFDFGKHRGKTLEEVFQCQPYYILWCLRNIDTFLLHEELLLEYKRRCTHYFDISNQEDGFPKRVCFYTVYFKDEDFVTLRNKWNRYEMELENEDYTSVHDNPYYNDNLDMDQQDPDFWDSF
jgi:hypothetical protein